MCLPNLVFLMRMHIFKKREVSRTCSQAQSLTPPRHHAPGYIKGPGLRRLVSCERRSDVQLSHQSLISTTVKNIQSLDLCNPGDRWQDRVHIPLKGSYELQVPTVLIHSRS